LAMTMLLDTDTCTNVRSSDTTTSTCSLLVRPDKRLRADLPARSSSTRLRSNLLRKLGICPTTSSSSATATLGVQSESPSNQHAISLLGNNFKIERHPLKTDDVEDLWSNNNNNNNNNIGSTATRRAVHFDPLVSAVTIPGRHEYSTRISRFLWDSPERMHINIVRNTLEFRADGWDYQAALDLDEHYFSPATQEYIHPIHLEIADMSPEEQALFVPATYVNPAMTMLVDPSYYYSMEGMMQLHGS
jgi:hypothetical protein